jgi:hypothetical protein
MRRNLPLEQVRAEVAADFERALAWWDEVQADPARLEALVNEAQERITSSFPAQVGTCSSSA